MNGSSRFALPPSNSAYEMRSWRSTLAVSVAASRSHMSAASLRRRSESSATGRALERVLVHRVDGEDGARLVEQLGRDAGAARLTERPDEADAGDRRLGVDGDAFARRGDRGGAMAVAQRVLASPLVDELRARREQILGEQRRGGIELGRGGRSDRLPELIVAQQHELVPRGARRPASFATCASRNSSARRKRPIACASATE